MTHILMCYFHLVIKWRIRGWLKGQIHILKIAITIPRKRMSRVITVNRRPRVPNVKTMTKIWPNFFKYTVQRSKSASYRDL